MPTISYHTYTDDSTETTFKRTQENTLNWYTLHNTIYSCVYYMSSYIMYRLVSYLLGDEAKNQGRFAKAL